MMRRFHDYTNKIRRYFNDIRMGYLWWFLVDMGHGVASELIQQRVFLFINITITVSSV